MSKQLEVKIRYCWSKPENSELYTCHSLIYVSRFWWTFLVGLKNKNKKKKNENKPTKKPNPHTMVIFQVMSLFANHKNYYSLKHVFILFFKKEKQTSNSLLLYSDHCDRLTNQNSFVKKQMKCNYL